MRYKHEKGSWRYDVLVSGLRNDGYYGFYRFGGVVCYEDDTYTIGSVYMINILMLCPIRMGGIADL